MRGISLWLAALTAIFLITGGCQKSRFATCENDDDCKKTDAEKPYCWNVRCVACAYDRHCGDGKVCDTNSKTCVGLD